MMQEVRLKFRQVEIGEIFLRCTFLDPLVYSASRSRQALHRDALNGSILPDLLGDVNFIPDLIVNEGWVGI